MTALMADEPMTFVELAAMLAKAQAEGDYTLVHILTQMLQRMAVNKGESNE